MTAAQFNADAAQKGYVATKGTLRYQVTGIDPNAGKGALAMFVNTIDKTGGGVPCVSTYLKVYGPGEDLGKVKNELSNSCCGACETCGAERSGATACETWSGEARSAVIFTSPSQICDVEARFGPSEHSYAITCNDGKGDSGVGANTYAMTVNEVYVLEGAGGIAKISGATVLAEEFCFESPGVADALDAGPTTKTMQIAVAEDVTVDESAPGTVYGDVTDLSVGQSEQVFLKFVVPSSVGTITKASLALTNSGEPSSEGDGASLYRIVSSDWSESTLTWSARPSRSEGALGHVGPVAANQAVSFDLTGAMSGAPSASRTYSFVLAAEAADLNGTHFHSKESSSTKAPMLTLEYVEGSSAGGAASPNGTSDVSPSSATDRGADRGSLPSAGDRPASSDGCSLARASASGSSLTVALLPVLFVLARVRRARRQR
jgi:hypothetical protein